MMFIKVDNPSFKLAGIPFTFNKLTPHISKSGSFIRLRQDLFEEYRDSIFIENLKTLTLYMAPHIIYLHFHHYWTRKEKANNKIKLLLEIYT